MSVKTLRRWAIFWTLFIGVGALVGGTGMFLDPTGKAMGMDALLPFFTKLPLHELLYQNYIFPGIALIIVNGLTQLFTFVLLLRCHRKAPACVTGCGVILMLWICIQFYMFPMNFMSTIYFIFGLTEAINGIYLNRKEART
ncbi:MAG: hypothetical protein VB111_10015 [Clostridiaceae bacterium]|nr:hypothetical protein [Clostridiaceae bacterium]